MSTDTIQKLARPSVLGGAMIIAGTAVGAGMFSIPIVTSGVWFSGSVALLVYTWACMLLSGLMILEATLHYPSGASFNTMVKDLLGKGWNAVNGLSVAFVLYILTYAYISAGGSIIAHTLEGIVGVGQTTAGLVFALVVAFIVWLSTRAVDRLSTILIGGMVITFVMSVGDMFTHVQPAVLFNTDDDQASYLPYALAALPYLLTSFGYHGNIPGLVKYYHKDGASTLMWTANSMYLINMPLYMVHELRLPERLVGVLMGTAAGVLFYCSLLFITGSWQLIALQLLNAAFIGVLAGIGMLYFQDLMPGQAGTATTLFTNTIRVGWVIAGAIAGAVAEIWNYHAVFYAALAMAAGATLCLWKLREV